MATKKRLSDLVREEVQKQAEDTTSPEASASQKRTKSRSSSKRQTSQAAAKKTAAPAKNVESDEIAALTAKLSTLEKDNQVLKADNSKLLTKVESLERSVEKAKATETALNSAQSKQKSMLIALDEAKQDALKLAQENQKLLDQIKALETQSAKPAAIAQGQPQKTQPARSPASHAIQRSSTRPAPAVYKAPAKKPFSRPVAPSRLPIRRVVQNSDEFETWCYD